jgi:hypothetical protein
MTADLPLQQTKDRDWKKTWFRKEHNLDTDTDGFDVTMRKKERWIMSHTPTIN